MSSVLLTVTVIGLFLVLYSCISYSLKQTELGDSKFIAPAATILCLIGMFGQFRVSQESSLFETVLLPWAALGYSLLFILLLCLIRRLCRSRDEECDISDNDGEIPGRNLCGIEEKRVECGSYHVSDATEDKNQEVACNKERIGCQNE